MKEGIKAPLITAKIIAVFNETEELQIGELEEGGKFILEMHQEKGSIKFTSPSGLTFELKIKTT